MATSLTDALNEVVERLSDSESFVRLVLSGRRRNMQTPNERIDVKPVLIKSEIKYQVAQSDGRAMTTKNYSPQEFLKLGLLDAGFANIHLEEKEQSISIRITKKGEALISRARGEFAADLSHDRSKSRLLDPADPFLIEVGISDSLGKVKASKNDKYLQVEEFLRLLIPSLNSAIEAGHIHKPDSSNPLTIVDLGCGHAYLTFAAHQYLKSQGVAVKVVGIDVRESARVRNNEIAKKLGIDGSIEFRAEEISETTLKEADVSIALHACDTATDDALAWSVKVDAKLVLVAPCCHHDIQAQMVEVPEPWSMITKNGIMKERLGDLITDGLRIQIMKLSGYRVEAIEFIGGEHTPRNLMIRAVKTGAVTDPLEEKRYVEMLSLWKVKPALAALLNR
jgi:SAM-dependent methyltransferase